VIDAKKYRIELFDKTVIRISGKFKRLYYVPSNGSYGIKHVGDCDKHVIVFRGNNMEIVMAKKDTFVLTGEVLSFDINNENNERELTYEACGDVFRLSSKDYETIYGEDPEYSPC
jgi:hypothetical protein